MKIYYSLCVIIYFLSECYGKCLDYYVILERIDLNNFMIADMNNIDIFTHPYNNSEEFKEMQENKDCIITEYVKVNECYTETISTDNSTLINSKYGVPFDTDHSKPINLTENNRTNLTEEETYNMTENSDVNNKSVNDKMKKAPYTDISERNHNINGTKANDYNNTNESSDINAEKTRMDPNKVKNQNNSNIKAIVVASVVVASGVLVFAVKKLLYCMQQGSYHLPEPNTSV